MKALHSIVLLMGLASGFFATGQQAKAAAYGAFVLDNPSSVTIHYQVKWGNGEWKSYSIGPGYMGVHWTYLDENGNVPRPLVRFDYICDDDEVTFKTYNVDVYATDYPREGKMYVFHFSSYGRFLDLYSK
jgi:hypothetical protein